VQTFFLVIWLSFVKGCSPLSKDVMWVTSEVDCYLWCESHPRSTVTVDIMFQWSSACIWSARHMMGTWIWWCDDSINDTNNELGCVSRCGTLTLGRTTEESVFEFLQDTNSSQTPDLLLVPPNFVSSIYLRFSSWVKAAEAWMRSHP